MKELILSERHRPHTIEDMVLLPRIRKIFENGLTENVILHGHCGTGKTTLANILIGVYTKDKPYLSINASKDTSIDILRNQIDEFCSTVYMGMELTTAIKADSMKYVFLDECERISPNFQDALKSYIETTDNVRFILNTNHINKLTKELKSRFLLVNFDCVDITEEKTLKNLFCKKIFNVIAPKENFTIAKEDVMKLVNKNFPDFRHSLIALDNFIKSGNISDTSVIDLKGKEELYKIILDKPKSYNDTYHYLMNNFGDTKIDELISLLGRPFASYILENHQDLSEKLFDVAYIITEHTKLLETKTDPIILGMTIFNKINNLFN